MNSFLQQILEGKEWPFPLLTVKVSMKLPVTASQTRKQFRAGVVRLVIGNWFDWMVVVCYCCDLTWV